MKIYSTIFLFLISLSLTAQQEKEKINSSTKGYLTTLNLPNAIFPNAARYNLGYIYNLNNKLKAGVELGYGNDKITFFEFNTYEEKFNFWEIRPEFYYVLNPNKKTLKYFSAEIFYTNYRTQIHNGNYTNTSGTYFQYDKIDYSKQKYGIIPKFGMFINFTERLGINCYVGLGIRNKINKYSNAINLREKDAPMEGFWLATFTDEGSRLGAEFNLGFKLFYRL